MKVNTARNIYQSYKSTGKIERKISEPELIKKQSRKDFEVFYKQEVELNHKL